MSKESLQNLNDVSMADLFRREIETQSLILTDGLLALERDASASPKLAEMMRAAHSLKGAARIVSCQAAVKIAHAMEDCFVAAQKNNLNIERHIDALLAGVDLLGRIGQLPPQSFDGWGAEHEQEIQIFLDSLRRVPESQKSSAPSPPARLSSEDTDRIPGGRANLKRSPEASLPKLPAVQDRSLRVTTDNLNRLLALAGEGLLASRWLGSFTAEMTRMKHLNYDVERTAEKLREALSHVSSNSGTARHVTELREEVTEFHSFLSERLSELDRFDRRFTSFATRLYQEVIDCRMRPFSDGVQGFPRLVRELGKSLGKSMRLEVIGEDTTVDRDILESIKAPIDHLLRNAADHGIEPPGERQDAGKPDEGTLRLEAAHRAGKLLITVSDDGRGIDLEVIRKAVIGKKLATLEMANKLSDSELFEFLFLPGFTLREVVSEISGRGVGLDVVQTMVKGVGGAVRVSSKRGSGVCFQLELPLTVSVVRTLVVTIGGESYAFPLARIETALRLPRDQIQTVEGRQHFTLRGQQVGIVGGSEILGLRSEVSTGELSIVVLGAKNERYGLVVDRLVGEQELVVRSLDHRLGKVKNISAAALMPDGSPLLIIDVEDLVQDIERFLSGRRLTRLEELGSDTPTRARQRVLVVDDSLTVRELERKLLDGQGYAVDVAVDGMDGWNSVRTGHYDLVITDVDMPRLDGIELITLIRKDNRLKALPVMIVSYKDRPEDRQRGLEAGADYYLAKGSFHDQTLIRAVVDLIGETRP